MIQQAIDWAPLALVVVTGICIVEWRMSSKRLVSKWEQEEQDRTKEQDKDRTKNN